MRLTRPGFSLMEIIVVLGVASVLMASVVFLVNSPQEEEAVRKEHAKIEDFVRQGRALAVSYQQAFVVELSEGKVTLGPLINPNEQNVVESDGGLRTLAEQSWPRIEELDPIYELSVRRWGQQNFNLVTGDLKERWILEPAGLCEPVAILLSKDFGDNSLSRIYHPLTGMAEDESLTITGKR
ncbi:MAG: pilus assembly FimT family protein [Verrucomicrobiaceae bacterium]